MNSSPLRNDSKMTPNTTFYSSTLHTTSSSRELQFLNSSSSYKRSVHGNISQNRAFDPKDRFQRGYEMTPERSGMMETIGPKYIAYATPEQTTPEMQPKPAIYQDHELMYTDKARMISSGQRETPPFSSRLYSTPPSAAQPILETWYDGIKPISEDGRSDFGMDGLAIYTDDEASSISSDFSNRRVWGRARAHTQATEAAHFMPYTNSPPERNRKPYHRSSVEFMAMPDSHSRARFKGLDSNAQKYITRISNPSRPSSPLSAKRPAHARSTSSPILRNGVLQNRSNGYTESHLTNWTAHRDLEHKLERASSADYFSEIPIQPFETKFGLRILQQPKIAKVARIGDKERRALDPPPVLQLFAQTSTGESLSQLTDRYPFLICVASLCREDPEIKEEFVSCDFFMTNRRQSTDGLAQYKRLENALVGTNMGSPMSLIGPDGEEGLFYVFYDLSIRVEGTYRIKFSLLDLGIMLPHTPLPMLNSTRSRVIFQVMSDPFEVVPSSRYPGVSESTPLIKSFAKQGIKLPVRNVDSTTRKKRTRKVKTAEMSR